nr:30S ribosomal protein S16-1, chloroplastic-like [Populus alba]
MAVKIRLARIGCKNRAFYRIVAADSHTPKDGKHLQVVGFLDPLAAQGDARRLGLNVDLVKYWLSVGAQPTDTVRGILMRAGLISPPPMFVMGQKKGPAGKTLNLEKSITLHPALNGLGAKFSFEVVE